MKRDRDRMRDAFQELRSLGYWARMAQEDGWKSVPEDVHRRGGRVVFWHENQTSVSFDLHGDLRAPLHLHHRVVDGAEIARVLEQHGVRSKEETLAAIPRIVVYPKDEEPLALPELFPEAWLGLAFDTHLGKGPATQHLVLRAEEIDQSGELVTLRINDQASASCVVPTEMFARWLELGVVAGRSA